MLKDKEKMLKIGRKIVLMYKRNLIILIPYFSPEESRAEDIGMIYSKRRKKKPYQLRILYSVKINIIDLFQVNKN
jgi:hypothetical protein